MLPLHSVPTFLEGEGSELLEAVEAGYKSQLTWSGALWHPSSGNSLLESGCCYDSSLKSFGGAEVQGRPWVQNKFQASLGYKTGKQKALQFVTIHKPLWELGSCPA